MWNGTMFVDLDWPLNASSLLSASAELLVHSAMAVTKFQRVNSLSGVFKYTGWGKLAIFDWNRYLGNGTGPGLLWITRKS